MKTDIARRNFMGKLAVMLGYAGLGPLQLSAQNRARQTADGRIMAVDVKLGSAFESGTPHEMVKLPSNVVGRFAMASNGQRFLVSLTPQSVDRVAITVVLNWGAKIKN